MIKINRTQTIVQL